MGIDLSVVFEIGRLNLLGDAVFTSHISPATSSESMRTLEMTDKITDSRFFCFL
jgi:aconitase A